MYSFHCTVGILHPLLQRGQPNKINKQFIVDELKINISQFVYKENQRKYRLVKRSISKSTTSFLEIGYH